MEKIQNNEFSEEFLRDLNEIKETLENAKIGEDSFKKEIKKYLEGYQKTENISASLKRKIKEIHKLSPSQQIGILIELVFKKGLREAITLARNLNNPALLDEFHDLLVDRFYYLLKEKNILKNR